SSAPMPRRSSTASPSHPSPTASRTAPGRRSGFWSSIAMTTSRARRTSPDSADAVPASTRSSVDLPQPLRPTIPTRSPVDTVQEYERGVIFRLGRCVGAKGPGVFFIIPIFDKIIRTNLQIIVAPVAPQAVITKDNVTVRVDAVAYFQVMDAAASVVNIRDWYG